MEQTNKNIVGKPIVSRDLSDAVEQVLLDAHEAGIDLADIQDNKKYGGQFFRDQESLDELINLKTKGSAIPGQSLTNNPEQPRPFESPPEFANPRDALNYILSILLEPKATKELLTALVNGASVGDVATAILYSQFVDGKISPPTMLLIMEPIMYLIMGIAEEADINYSIDGDETDDPVDDELEGMKKEFNNFISKLTSKSNDINVNNLNTGVVEESMIEKIKSSSPIIKQSLLEKGDKNGT